MIPQYEYIVTGFIFGLIVALDIMCLVNIASALIKRRRKEKQKEREELQKLIRQVNYEDLPLIYRKALKNDTERKS